MDYIRLSIDNMSEIMLLQTRYKLEIGEDKPTDENMRSFFKAIKQEQILFFGCFDAEKLVACCSVSPTYSTFNYCRGGVFEDFYISATQDVGVSNIGNTLGAILAAARCQGKGGDLRSKYYLTLTPLPW